MGIWNMSPDEVVRVLLKRLEEFLQKNDIHGAEVRDVYNAKGQRVIGIILPPGFRKRGT